MRNSRYWLARSKLLLSGIAVAPILWKASFRGAGELPITAHLDAALNWLLVAQSHRGGYAHSFHFVHGWQAPYPETTGYIIPTMRRAWELTGNTACVVSLKNAAQWLLSIQRGDGSFQDMSNHPQVFDTGQILIGLNDLVRHPQGIDCVDAQKRAARWLCSVQGSDGSFQRYAYNSVVHSYYARVGAALIDAGELMADDDVKRAGIDNLLWTVRQQSGNGFFDHLSFNDAPPFLHTMVYVLEGLLDAYENIQEQSFLKSVLVFARKLSEISRRDGMLRSQYFPNYEIANAEKCLTGLAQWAGVSFRIARITGDDDWLAEGRRVIEFLFRQQIFCKDERLNGGLPGSAPFYGRYMRAAIPNWGMKFFLDALLLMMESATPMQAVSGEKKAHSGQ
jgi:hypothetical protein